MAPPHAFQGEIHASVMSEVGGKHKAASALAFQMLTSRTFGFATMKATCAVRVSKWPMSSAL